MMARSRAPEKPSAAQPSVGAVPAVAGDDPFRRAPAGFRIPPHNIDAEIRLLGSLMINRETVRRVAPLLKPEHFYEPVHGRIFDAIRRVNGRMVDEILLKPSFDQDETLKELGGGEYLTKLADIGTRTLPDQAEELAHHLVELYSRRGLIAVATEAVNRAFDLSIPESAADQAARVREQVETLIWQVPERRPDPCDLPALDWARVANDDPPKERWLIDEWIPVGTSGIITGPGAAGKSFLEIIRLVCMALGLPFLQGREHPGFPVEPTPCLAYFAEDRLERLWSRAAVICRALQVDPSRLIGRLEIVSTLGSHRHLITAEHHHSPTTTPTEWFHQVHDRARRMGARYVVFDHVGRYLAINRNDPNQVFSAFSHLDHFADSIDGAVGLLAHPSKTDIRTKAATKGGGPIVAYVGGSAAMIDAPRWVEVLDTYKGQDGERFRVLVNEKPNYTRRFAIKLLENERGIVQAVSEVDPDNPAGKSNSPAGRKSNADRTFLALEELFGTFHRAVHIDEIVRECVRRGILKEASENSGEWRERRRTVRQHLAAFTKYVEEREGDSFALKPGARANG